MNNILVAMSVVLTCSAAFAQGQRNNREQRPISVPENVFKSLINDEKKADSILSDLRLLQTVGLPLESYLELKLSPEQKKSFSEIVQTTQTQLRELIRNEDRDGATALRGQMQTKVNNLLTQDQKNVVAKYPARNQPGEGGQRGNRGGRGGRPSNPAIN